MQSNGSMNNRLHLQDSPRWQRMYSYGEEEPGHFMQVPFTPPSSHLEQHLGYAQQPPQPWTSQPSTLSYQAPLAPDHGWTGTPIPSQLPTNYTYYGLTSYLPAASAQPSAQLTQSYPNDFPSTTSTYLSPQSSYSWPTSPLDSPWTSDTWTPSFLPTTHQSYSVPVEKSSSPWSPSQYSLQSTLVSPQTHSTSFSSTSLEDEPHGSSQHWSEMPGFYPDPYLAAQALSTMSSSTNALYGFDPTAAYDPVAFSCGQERDTSTIVCSQPCDGRTCTEDCQEDCLSECSSPCLSSCSPCEDPFPCNDQCEDDICANEACLGVPSVPITASCSLFIDPRNGVLDSSVSPVPSLSPSSIHKRRCKWITNKSSGSLCGVAFDGPNDLQEHVEEVHIQPLTRSEGMICSWGGCTRSTKPFDQKLKLKRHVKSHSGYRGAVCDICRLGFADRHTLESHTRSHTRARPFKCTICFDSFAHKSVLTTHMRNHKGEKPFKCDFPDCEFATADSSNLSKHKKTHKEGTYPCPQCGKVFKKPSNIKRHLETHTRDKSTSQKRSIDMIST